jgi:hypothetical protein
MKVKINDEETYEINLKDEYSREEFASLLEKLDKISNLIQTPAFLTNKKKKAGRPKLEKPTQSLPASIPKKSRKKSKVRVRWDNRDEVLKALNIHYNGTKEDKQAYAREKGIDWDKLIKGFSGLRKRYNVKPKELGISKFPTRTEKIWQTIRKEKKAEDEPETKKKADGLISLNLHHEVKEAVNEGKIPEELAMAYNLVNKEDQLKFFKLFSLTHRGLDMQIKALKDFSTLDEKGKEEIRQNLKNL